MDLESLIWEDRILEERELELEEYKMTTESQINSQISRVSATLERQRVANHLLEQHINELDEEIRELTLIYENCRRSIK